MRKITRLPAPIAVALMLGFSCAGLAQAPARIGAQELTGVVRLPDGVTAAPGVLLAAMRPSDAAVLGRALSGANGAFVLRVPPGELRLRALRVGFRPTELGTYTVAAGERRHLTLTLGNEPVVLTAVTSRATARCQLFDRAGTTVATLFDEARKALFAMRLAPPEGRPTATVMLETSLDAPSGGALRPTRREIRTGLSSRPFRAVPIARLEASGYVVEESDGTSFFAPDADVLLSDRFAASHCLRLVDAPAGKPEWLGIGFQPVGPARGIVRIRGTLWLDRATFALQRLDYSYVGLSRPLAAADLGGFVDFTQLSDGLWFEDRWEIRMARTTIERRVSIAAIGRDASVDRVRVDAIQRTGGVVLSIGGDRPLYTVTGIDTAVVATVTAAATAAQADPAIRARDALLQRAECDVPPAVPDTEGVSTLYGFAFERMTEPLPDAEVVATWKAGFREVGPNAWVWVNHELRTTSEDDGFYALCGLPRVRLITMQVRKGARESRKRGVRIAATASDARADLQLDPPR